jgi:hypothetical protein
VKKSKGLDMLGRASHQEALKLVFAFMCIMEPEKRAGVLAIAERYAEAPQIVDASDAFIKLRPRSAPPDDG